MRMSLPFESLPPTARQINLDSVRVAEMVVSTGPNSLEPGTRDGTDVSKIDVVF